MPKSTLTLAERIEAIKCQLALKVSEASLISGIPETTIRKAVNAGELKRLYPPPSDCRFARADFDEYLETLRRGT